MSPLPRPSRISGVTLLWITAGLVAGLCCSGCGNGKSEPAEKTKSLSVTKTHPEKSSSDPGKKKKDPGPSADAAVKAVLQGIRNNQPEAVWEFLPGSYQKDINGVFHLFAEKMDPELWNRTVSLGKRVVKLCRSRKKEILTSPVFATQAAADPDALVSDWEATLLMAETLLNSRLADLKQMNSFDGGKFLASTGGKLMKQLSRFSQLLPGNQPNVELEELAKFDAKVISVDDRTAVVELSLKGETEVQKVEFVRIDGKWFPKKLAESLPDYVKSLRAKIQKELAADVLEKKKKAAFLQYDRIEQELAKLEAAQTPGEFQNLFTQSPVAAVIAGLFRQANNLGNPPPSVIPKVGKKTPTGKAQRITVIVQGTLNPAAADQVADKLFGLAKDADIGDFTVSGNTTQFPVTTKMGFEAFRKAITFAEVVSADKDKREIVIRLK